MELRHSRHSVSALQYHFVFCPKYRKPLLMPGIDTRLKLIIIDLAEFHNWDVQSVEVMPDHVHMLLAADPKWSCSEIMKWIKGKSSFLLRKEFPELKASIPAQLWTHSFYVASVGGTNENVVKRYIENQRKEMKG
jgi:putative transposase